MQLCVGGVWTHPYLCSMGPPHLCITYLHACGVLLFAMCSANFLLVVHTCTYIMLTCLCLQVLPPYCSQSFEYELVSYADLFPNLVCWSCLGHVVKSFAV